LLERDGGGVGEGRSFHICSSKMGDVRARGGSSTFARARWGMCRRWEGVCSSAMIVVRLFDLFCFANLIVTRLIPVFV
jgi:hypothetical protein